MQRLTEQEKVRIAELSALGLPSRRIGKQIGRHHRTVLGLHLSVATQALGPTGDGADQRAQLVGREVGTDAVSLRPRRLPFPC